MMKKRIVALATLMTLSSALVAAHDGAIEATLGLGEYRPDGDRGIEDSSYKYLGLGYNINDEWTAELWGAGHDTNRDPKNRDLDASSFGVKGLYSFFDKHDTVSPYFVMGLAHAQIEALKDGRENGVQLGLGSYFTLTDWMRLRLEVTDTRYQQSRDNDWQWFAGVNFLFGGAHPAPAPKPAPAPLVVAEPVAPVAAPVAPPAPLDSDHDGVYDNDDACPGTPAGLKVNAKGCAQLTEKVSIKLNVQFDTAKSVVKPEFNTEIEKVARFMRDYPTTKVVIEGHTDNVGNAAYNKKLSQARADAVAASLVKDHGITADRVSAVGYGMEKPLADNGNAEGRAMNRRVTAEIDEQIVKQQ